MKVLIFALFALISSVYVPSWSPWDHLDVDQQGFTHLFIQESGKNIFHCVTRGDIGATTEDKPPIYFSNGMPTWKTFKSMMIYYSNLGHFVFACDMKCTGASACTTSAYEEMRDNWDIPRERSYNLTQIGYFDVTSTITQIIGSLPFIGILNGPGANVALSGMYTLRDQLKGLVFANMPAGPYHPTRHNPDKLFRESKEGYLTHMYKVQEVTSPFQYCLENLVASQFTNPMLVFTDPVMKMKAMDICNEYALSPYPLANHAQGGASLQHALHWGLFDKVFWPAIGDKIPVLFMQSAFSWQFPADLFDGSWACEYNEAGDCGPVTNGRTVFDIIPNVYFDVFPQAGGVLASPLEFESTWIDRVDRYLESLKPAGAPYVAGQDFAACMYNGYYYNSGGYYCYEDKKCYCNGHMSVSCVVEACEGEEGKIPRTPMQSQMMAMADMGLMYTMMNQQYTAIWNFGPLPNYGRKQEMFTEGFEGEGFNTKQVEQLWSNKE